MWVLRKRLLSSIDDGLHIVEHAMLDRAHETGPVFPLLRGGGIADQRGHAIGGLERETIGAHGQALTIHAQMRDGSAQSPVHLAQRHGIRATHCGFQEPRGFRWGEFSIGGLHCQQEHGDQRLFR